MSISAVVSFVGVVVFGWFAAKGQMQAAISDACGVIIPIQSLLMVGFACTVWRAEVKDPSPTSTPLVSPLLCTSLALLFSSVAAAHWIMPRFEIASYVLVFLVALGQVAIFLLASTFVEVVNGSKSLAVILKLSGEAVLIGAIINVASGTVLQPAIERLVSSSGAMWRNHTVAEGVSNALHGTIREFALTQSGSVKDRLLVVGEQARNAWIDKPDVAMSKELAPLREPLIVRCRLKPDLAVLDPSVWEMAILNLSPDAAGLDTDTRRALAVWLTSRFATTLKVTSDQNPAFSDALRWHEQSEIRDAIRRIEVKSVLDPDRASAGTAVTWRAKWLLQLLVKDLYLAVQSKVTDVQGARDYETATGAILSDRTIEACEVFERRAAGSREGNPTHGPSDTARLWTAWLALELNRPEMAKKIAAQFADPETSAGREGRMIVLSATPSLSEGFRAAKDLALSRTTPPRLKAEALAVALTTLYAGAVEDAEDARVLLGIVADVRAGLESSDTGLHVRILEAQLECAEEQRRWTDALNLCGDLEALISRELTQYETVRMRKADAMRALGQVAAARDLVNEVRKVGLGRGSERLVYSTAIWEARCWLADGDPDRAWQWAKEAARCSRSDPAGPNPCIDLMEQIISKYFSDGVRIEGNSMQIDLVALNRAAEGLREYSDSFGTSASYRWVYNAMSNLSDLVINDAFTQSEVERLARSPQRFFSEMVALVLSQLDPAADTRLWLAFAELDLSAALSARDPDRLRRRIESIDRHYWSQAGFQRRWFGYVHYAERVAGTYPELAVELLNSATLSAPKSVAGQLVATANKLRERLASRGQWPVSVNDRECINHVRDLTRDLQWNGFYQRTSQMKARLAAAASAEIAVATLEDLEPYLDSPETMIDETVWCGVWEKAALFLIDEGRSAVALDCCEAALSRACTPVVEELLCTVAQVCARGGSHELIERAIRLNRAKGDKSVLQGTVSKLIAQTDMRQSTSESVRELLTSRSSSKPRLGKSGAQDRSAMDVSVEFGDLMVYWTLDLMQPAGEQLSRIIESDFVQTSDQYVASFRMLEARIALRKGHAETALARMTDAMLAFTRSGNLSGYAQARYERAGINLQNARYEQAIEDYEACRDLALQGAISAAGEVSSSHGAAEARWRSRPRSQSLDELRRVATAYGDLGLDSLGQAVSRTVESIDSGTYEP